MAPANIGGVAYMFAFFTNGGAQYVNLETPTAPVTLASSGTFSGTRTQISQWKNERVLIIDTTYGYATFDGTNLVRVGSVGTVTITAAGSGYTSAPIVTFSVPNQTGGIQATATATVTSNAVTAITIGEYGTGYTSAPTVYIGTSGATAWVASTAFQTGRLLSSGGNYYYVTVGGTTSSSAPVHTSGSATNGTCTLLYVADPNGAGSSATATAEAINQPTLAYSLFLDAYGLLTAEPSITRQQTATTTLQASLLATLRWLMALCTVTSRRSSPLITSFTSLANRRLTSFRMFASIRLAKHSLPTPISALPLVRNCFWASLPTLEASYSSIGMVFMRWLALQQPKLAMHLMASSLILTLVQR